MEINPSSLLIGAILGAGATYLITRSPAAPSAPAPSVPPQLTSPNPELLPEDKVATWKGLSKLTASNVSNTVTNEPVAYVLAALPETVATLPTATTRPPNPFMPDPMIAKTGEIAPSRRTNAGDSILVAILRDNTPVAAKPEMVGPSSACLPGTPPEQCPKPTITPATPAKPGLFAMISPDGGTIKMVRAAADAGLGYRIFLRPDEGRTILKLAGAGDEAFDPTWRAPTVPIVPVNPASPPVVTTPPTVATPPPDGWTAAPSVPMEVTSQA